MRIKMQCPDCGKWFTLQLSVKEADESHASAAGAGPGSTGHDLSGSSQTSVAREGRERRQRERGAAWLHRIAPVLVVAALVLIWFFAVGPAIERSRTGARTGVIEESAASSAEPDGSVAGGTVLPPVAHDALSSKASAAVTPAGASAVTPAEPMTQALELTLTATERCWVRVISDGRVVSDLTLAAGEKRVWMADSYFEVDVGSGEDVQVRLNGEYLGPAGPGPRVVEGLRITKDGFLRD